MGVRDLGVFSCCGDVHRICFAWVRYWRDEFASGEIDLLLRCWDRCTSFLCKCLAISKRIFLLVSSAVFGNSFYCVRLYKKFMDLHDEIRQLRRLVQCEILLLERDRSSGDWCEWSE